MRSSFVAAMSCMSLLVLGSSVAAQPQEPQERRAAPQPEREQIAQRGVHQGAAELQGTTPQRVCQPGAKWLRLRVSELSLRGNDSVTLAGSAGGTFTLTARHWPGKAFHTRAFQGDCVQVSPNVADPGSRYTIDSYQAGTQAETVTVAAVGDICGSSCDQTAALIQNMNPDALITAGDNAYNSGTLSEFNNVYHPHYGQFKPITYPTPGNHEYNTSGASGYFDYYGSRAGERGKGYYSFDVGDWHFVALNSNISRGAGSTQEQWLRADLAANTKPCTAAYWHHARFSRGSHGDNTSVQALYQALYDARADLLIVGHDHNYQRFAPSRPNGTRDDTNGLRQFVIGTGGRSFYAFDSTPAAVVEASNANTFGVGKLTLSATGYRVDFVPVAGRTYTDTVSGGCHNANQSPDFSVTVSPASVTTQRGSSTSATVTVASTGGFNAATNLAVSGLPGGVTAAWSANPVTPPANGTRNSTLTLTASASAAIGSTNLTVTATSGALSRQATLRLTIDSSDTVFADDFESDRGWTVNPSGGDTATTGQWERGDPEQTVSSSNQIRQRGDTTSGANCMVTGRLAGSSEGAHDVDGGVTSVRSPLISLPAGTNTLSFNYTYGHGSNATSADYLRVKVIVGSTATTVFERLGAASERAGVWQPASVNLSGYSGQAVRVLIESADAATASLWETAVDDVVITNGGSAAGFSDDFEADRGWTVNPGGSDTATTGVWERGDPEETVATNVNEIKQRGDTTSGVNCLVTGRLAGSSYGANDVDGGVTSIRSPMFLVPSGGKLTFKYNVAHGNNATNADYFRVRVVDGTTTTTVFEVLGIASTEVNGLWRNGSADLAAFAGREVRLLIETADAATGSLWEAAVDDVTVA